MERASFELRLFGPVRLFRDGTPTPVPAGRCQKLLTLLVLNGGSANRDALCAALWPEARVRASHRSLRTLLTRLRGATGLHIEREGDLVVIQETVWCDVEEFIRTATAAAATVDDLATRNRLAVRAQELWRGPPLDSWRYEPWAAEVRVRAVLLQKSLWAMLGESADTAS